MTDFLTKLINLLLEDTSAIKIDENTQGEITNLNVSCPSSQIGRLIGKGGHTVRALRTLINIKGISQGKQVLIKLLEPLNQE